MDILDELKKLADNFETVEDKTIFYSKSGFNVDSLKVKDSFTEIVLETDRLVLFNKKCYARIIPKNEWDSIKFI